MIKYVTITNHLGESYVLDLRSPETSFGFLITSIHGLGPSKATINTSKISSQDGSIYNSSRVEERNIVFGITFVGYPTIENTRLLCYKCFPLGQQITIKIETDIRVYEIVGYVESNEINIFSPREAATISIICPNPYFYSTEKTVTVFSAVEALFEFPFSNESTSDKLINFGDIVSKMYNTIYYDGSVSVGVVMNIHAIGSATDITITNSLTHETMFIDTTKMAALLGSGITAGDDIVISTISGDKSIFIYRNGLKANILNCLDKNSVWFKLNRGDNLFAFTAETGINNLFISVTNDTVYEGI